MGVFDLGAEEACTVVPIVMVMSIKMCIDGTCDLVIGYGEKGRGGLKCDSSLDLE